jgi:5-methylcytosine-specific restriction protein A
MGAQIANRASNFRNANGVYMKVMNFRRFDSAYISQGKTGLRRGGKLEQEVWDHFAFESNDLSETARAIRQLARKRQIPIAEQDEDADFAEAEEGEFSRGLHRSRERSHELVAKKKTLTLKVHGRLQCEACSFDFEIQCGLRGAGFIEAHHTKPPHALW